METKRLRLRKISYHDISFLYKLHIHEDVNRYLDRKIPSNEGDVESFITRIKSGVERSEWYYWIVKRKDTDESIGTICLWNFNNDKTQCDIGYELLPESQGLGFMTEACESVLNFAYNTLSIDIVNAVTHKDNKPSKRLLERMGFSYQSIFDNGYEVLYQKER